MITFRIRSIVNAGDFEFWMNSSYGILPVHLGTKGVILQSMHIAGVSYSRVLHRNADYRSFAVGYISLQAKEYAFVSASVNLNAIRNTEGMAMPTIDTQTK